MSTGTVNSPAAVSGRRNNSGRGVSYGLTRSEPVEPRIQAFGASGAIAAYANLVSQAVEPHASLSADGAMLTSTPGMGPGIPSAR